MTKLFDVALGAKWQKLNTLAGQELTGVIELFNAGREGSSDIFWTESAVMPTAGDYFRILCKQKSAVITVGTQAIWVCCEQGLGKAKLMVSKPNTDTINIGATI